MESKHKEFLLEVGTEEIPAWMIEDGLAELKRLLGEGFERFGLLPEQGVVLETYATPRRLVAYCPHLAARQPSSTELVQGPPKRVAFDAEGKPTNAAIQFAGKMGTTPEKLKTVKTPKGEYVAFRKRNPGKPTPEILRELVPQAVLAISFPRSMYWEGKAGPRFIRPIRSLVVLYGGRPVACSVGSVEAAPWSFGHRRLGQPRLRVRNFAGYRETLRANFVLLDARERREKILSEIETLLGSGNGFRLKANEELLNTLVYLTEYPTPLLGEFDPAFLSLPEEVLITVMRGHQKYFSVEQPGGTLAPRFVAVMNLDADRSGAIRHGHERVLRARFNDARFFWETDGKLRLEERLERLRHVTFQSQLGSYFDKAGRMSRLAGSLGSRLGLAEDKREEIQKAALLAKCDLTTELVKEFTELQGVVGGLYARREGMAGTIADAIYDHYKPQSMEDALPRSLNGDLVSLADRLDTLAGCFGAGLMPSGSKDPFGLRRAAQGVIRILIEHDVSLTLGELIEFASRQYQDLEGKQGAGWSGEAVEAKLKPFLADRLRYYLREVRGFAYDEVNAVLAAGDEDAGDALDRVEAVARVRPTENFEPLAVAFKRIKNILEQARRVHGFTGGVFDPSLLEPGPESELQERYRSVAGIVAREKQAGDYWAALEAVASLRPDVDRFFDTVLVMAPQENVRTNRLVLLQALWQEFSTIADFSEIVTAEERKKES